MNDYIRRIDAIGATNDELSITGEENMVEVATYIQNVVMRLKEANGLDIIQCKDCEWWDKEYRECHSPNWYTGPNEYFVTPPGFFCGWANRKR